MVCFDIGIELTCEFQSQVQRRLKSKMTCISWWLLKML